MHPSRDLHLQLGVRQRCWLRQEHMKRVWYVRHALRRALLRALAADASTTGRQRVLVKQRAHALPRLSMGTKQTTRCAASGRARQAFRATLLARMHYRAHLRYGNLPHTALGRT